MALPTNVVSPLKDISFGAQTMRRLANTPFPKGTSCLFQTGEPKNGIWVKRKTTYRLSNDSASFCLMDDSISRLSASQNPASDMIKNLYICINEKNLEELGKHISEDCLIEDSSFIKPFKGKKEAMHFFKELTQSMGQDVKFRISNVYEKGASGAGAIWHLAWKETEIPFTKGCTFIDIKKGERQTIWKAQIIIEPQFKAGHLMLTLMKSVTLLLAKFPAIFEWFLKASQQRWTKWLSKLICLILSKRILDNYLKNYLTFPRSGAQLSNYAFNILQYISKAIFK